MRRNVVLALAVLLAVVTGFVVYVDRTTPSWYERIRYPLRYSEYVRAHAAEHGLDPALVAAVIYQESKFRASVVSSSGAIGLMQLTPATARGIAIRTGGTAFRTQDLFDPEINIRYGAWYLDNLFKKYGSETLVLAAYNAGQGKRRPLACAWGGDPVPGDPCLHQARRAPEVDLSPCLALEALSVEAVGRR